MTVREIRALTGTILKETEVEREGASSGEKGGGADGETVNAGL